MEVLLINEDLKEKWNNFVKKNGTFLESWEWGEFKNRFSWSPYRLAVIEGNTWILVASVLCRHLPLSKSFLYIPEGPILNEDLQLEARNKKLKIAFENLLQKIKEIAEKEKAIFLRVEPLENYTEQLINLGFKKSFEDIQPAHRLWIDLNHSEEKIFSQMKHKGRYNIKIAIRRGVKIKEVNAQKMLDIFYRLYLETAKRDKFTARPREYFSILFKTLEKHGYAKMLIALWKNQPLSTVLIVIFGKFATYLYGASSSVHRELMASYLIQWEAIKIAKQEGLQIYDLGAIAPNEDKHVWSGLREFKTKFGGRQVDLPGCYDLIYSPFLYNFFRIMEKIRRREI